jgi:hypothetical protein
VALKKRIQVRTFGTSGNVVGITHILWTPTMGKDVVVHYGVFADNDAYVGGATPLVQFKVTVPNAVGGNIRRKAYEYIKDLPGMDGREDLIIDDDAVFIGESHTAVLT